MKALKLGSTAVACYHERSRAGIPSGADWSIGQAGMPRDGIWVRFGARLADGRIIDARYEVFGCPAAVAAAAWAADRVIGATPAMIASLAGREIAEALELPVEKTGVALVVEDALKDALAASGSLIGQD